jgi:predicted small lipoprotein YifL
VRLDVRGSRLEAEGKSLQLPASNLKPLAFALTLTLAFVLLSACGRKGPPVVPKSIVPDAVKELKADQRMQSVTLSWLLPAENIDKSTPVHLAGFIVLRGEHGPAPAKGCCEHQKIATLDLEWIRGAKVEGNRVLFLDRGEDLSPPGLRYGRTYGYKVIPIGKKEVLGKESPEVRITLQAPPAPPTDPQALAGDGRVTLTWSPPAQNVDGTTPPRLKGYNLYRKTEGGAYGPPVNKMLLTVPRFVDIGLTNGRTYHYHVRSAGAERPGWNEGPESAEVRAVPRDTTPPAAPEGFTAAVAGREVRLSWKENREGDLLGYRVYRSTDRERGYAQAAEVPLLQTTFTDRPGKGTYYYRVTAVDRAAPPNESAPSGVARVRVEN